MVPRTAGHSIFSSEVPGIQKSGSFCHLQLPGQALTIFALTMLPRSSLLFVNTRSVGDSFQFTEDLQRSQRVPINPSVISPTSKIFYYQGIFVKTERPVLADHSSTDRRLWILPASPPTSSLCWGIQFRDKTASVVNLQVSSDWWQLLDLSWILMVLNTGQVLCTTCLSLGSSHD